MIRRLALVLGGAGAAGVFALAVSLGGANTTPPTSDALVPVANNMSAADQSGVVPAATDQPIAVTPKKIVDKVYVQPSGHKPAVHQPTVHQPTTHSGGGAANNPPSSNGGNHAGDDQPSHHGGGTHWGDAGESGGD